MTARLTTLPTPKRLGGRARFFAAMIAAFAAAAVLANTAAADEYWRSGVTGQVQTYKGVCQYLDYWNQHRLATQGPIVYARNATVYRDRQIVRYAAYIVDSSGRTIRGPVWSGYYYAYDDSAAQLPSVGYFDNVPRGSRIDLRIEWYNDSWQLVAASAHRINEYLFVYGSMGVTGTGDSCVLA